MKKYFTLFFLVLFTSVTFCLIWANAEEGDCPYALGTKYHEWPAAFTNQFSGVTNETLRRSILVGFDELPFARTGIVERTQSGSTVTLTLPLVPQFLPEIKTQSLFRVKVRFQEPTGEFLPSPNASSPVETLLAFRCREKLREFSNYNTNATCCYWRAPLQDYGGLARIPFYDLPKGSDESSSVGTNGWGFAFWVDLDTSALLNWEIIYPPEEDGE